MVQAIQKSIVNQRKKIIPGLIALALLAGLVISLIGTTNAQADYFVGCGYGYNSSGTGFGYGPTGAAHGYGFNQSGTNFGYGNGEQVCPTTTTTSVGGGGGGGSTTTTAPGTTTTTAPGTTTTTAPPKKRFYSRGVRGFAEPGKSLILTVLGAGFHGNPKITSNEAGTRVGVLHDHGTSLVIRVTVRAGSRTGEHTLTIRFADGQTCKANYSVR
jgi:hypothetical protein